MFGSKLRAWMEAVRPKKKQHRKEKQGKNNALLNTRPNTNNHTVTWKNTCLLDSEKKDIKREPSTKYVKPHNEKNDEISRYSATNLSSPESAYSTGYSTDGTSPGAPPDYVINSCNKKSEERLENRHKPEVNTQLPCSSKAAKYFLKSQPAAAATVAQETLKTKESVDERVSAATASPLLYFGSVSENTTSGIMSPRQRNRIRTNPWLPGGTTSAAPSPLPVRQQVMVTPTAFKKIRNSPIQHRYLSPVTHRRSLSSSSCSSLSAGLNHSFEQHFPRSFSDEDDCTLNEMMGKYDESYVYEKETDILSDDDPTDCESDIDTGQDGGDEDDNADVELDYIDNGSYVEMENKMGNTGHCLYFIPPDLQRKRSSRRRTTRKTKEFSNKRRRSSNGKKCHRHSAEKNRHWSLHQGGSKSAGATPISVRKSNQKLTHNRLSEEYFKKRSNSVCLQRDTAIFINNRDREADLKYKELIGQAEQIIRTMNINGLSPRRLPGPTNKRVELLRSTECAKPDVIFKNKLTDEITLTNSNISPSNAIFKNNRFSPKKNHITNFIINNSPILVRKELQLHSPIAIKKNSTEEVQKYLNEAICQKPSPKNETVNHPSVKILKKSAKEYHEVPLRSPASSRRNHQSTILSPRHRRATEVPIVSSSSEEESVEKSKKRISKSCPQSEPLRRKVYLGRNTINITKGHGKTVAFNLNTETPKIFSGNNAASSENLRHQVLLNTIQSLKRNLENQSASLQQSYKSAQNMYKY